ncbi:MAG: M3 family oligoendopeptidase [Defluviitaleaceae bacterium]|nr:M3 family oligoendopeptidase [Defluviitaleaceae bacterium]
MNTRWQLNDLYTSFNSSEFLKDYEDSIKYIKEFSTWAKEAFSNKDNAKEKIENYINQVNNNKTLLKLMQYSYLTTSVDESNDTANKYVDKLRTLYSDLTEPNVLFRAYVSKVDIKKFISESSILKEHEFILNEILENSKYLLSDKEEIIISKFRNTGSDSWNTMKEQLLANTKTTVLVDGVEKILPLPAANNLLADPNPQTRKNAFFALENTYKTVEKSVAASLNAIKGEVITNSSLRGYENPLDMALKSYRMKKETLETMISAMVESLPMFRKFLKKKAKLLGHKSGLPMYDISAPIGNVNMKFTWEEAVKFILDNFYSYSTKLGDYANNAFNSGWVDSEVREGKRGGAFCSNLHSIGQSRIMLNFDGTLRNVTTLAHEFGHAYHGECLKNVPFLKSSYTMPIAESASTFCETIVTDAAIEKVKKEEALIILEGELSDATTIIVDIYARYLFELRFFEKRLNGTLSVEEINKLMEDAQKEAYGDGIDENYLNGYAWVNKPHYYYAERNFYNFPYAFGFMFSKGLYAQYLKEGNSFLEKYDNLLAITGSATVEEIGSIAGIDVTKKEFWQNSLNLIEAKIKKFCELVD